MGQDRSEMYQHENNLASWLSMWPPVLHDSSHEHNLADGCFFCTEIFEANPALLDTWNALMPTSSVSEKNQQDWAEFTIPSPLYPQQYSPAASTPESEYTSIYSEMASRHTTSSSGHSSPTVPLVTPLGSSFPLKVDDLDSEGDNGLRMVQSGPEHFETLISKSPRKSKTTECRLQRRREQNRVSQKRYRNKKEALIVEAEHHVQELEKMLHSRLQQINAEEERIAELNKEISMVRVKAFSCQQLAVLSLHS